MTLDHLWHRYDFINDLSLRHFDKLLSNGDYRHVAVLVYWDVDVIVDPLNAGCCWLLRPLRMLLLQRLLVLLLLHLRWCRCWLLLLIMQVLHEAGEVMHASTGPHLDPQLGDCRLKGAGTSGASVDLIG